MTSTVCCKPSNTNRVEIFQPEPNPKTSMDQDFNIEKGSNKKQINYKLILHAFF